MNPIRGEKIIVSIGENKWFEVLDAEKAFGDDFSNGIRSLLINGTAQDNYYLITTVVFSRNWKRKFNQFQLFI